MSTLALRVEHVVWTPGSDWRGAIDHLANRFARAHELDADAIHSLDGLDAQVAALSSWALDAGVDLDRELGRYLDEHLAMHVRPDPAVTRLVRARASTVPIHAVTILGERCAESLLRHTGCWRSITRVHGSVPTGALPEELEGAAQVASLEDLAQ